MKSGIMVAGNVLVDKIFEIDSYPNKGELTQIKSVKNLALGGLIPNVGIALKKIDKNLKVYAYGKIGDDEEGKFVLTTLKSNGVDTDNIIFGQDKTSFTNVFSICSGERTFFTYAGASREYGYLDFDFSKITAKYLHLGYFLLLDKIDNGDGEKILKKAKENKIITSIDLVSENSDRYNKVIPCLKYVDNLIINEIEAGKLTKIEPKKENIKDIAIKLKELGVIDRVIIHMPDFGVILSNEGYSKVPSLELPKGFIKGTTGAGDCFCAGALYAIYNGFRDKEILEFASGVAAISLSTFDATGGVLSKDEIINFTRNLKRKTI